LEPRAITASSLDSIQGRSRDDFPSRILVFPPLPRMGCAREAFPRAILFFNVQVFFLRDPALSVAVGKTIASPPFSINPPFVFSLSRTDPACLGRLPRHNPPPPFYKPQQSGSPFLILCASFIDDIPWAHNLIRLRTPNPFYSSSHALFPPRIRGHLNRPLVKDALLS